MGKTKKIISAVLILGVIATSSVQLTKTILSPINSTHNNIIADTDDPKPKRIDGQRSKEIMAGIDDPRPKGIIVASIDDPRPKGIIVAGIDDPRPKGIIVAGIDDPRPKGAQNYDA